MTTFATHRGETNMDTNTTTDRNSNTQVSMKTPTTSFYSNKTIFITGATGFVGKVIGQMWSMIFDTYKVYVSRLLGPIREVTLHMSRCPESLHLGS